MHPWHDVNPTTDSPEIFQALIEISKGSKAKYEIDKPTGLLKLDRVLFSAVHYPANYGFIPQTYAGDHDPLDILVFCQIDIPPLTRVKASVIGVMRMIDKGEMDDKIIAVASNDVSVNYVQNFDDLPLHLLLEIKRFFEDYKKLEQKSPVIVDQFLGKKEALEIIKESIDEYKKRFSKGATT